MKIGLFTYTFNYGGVSTFILSLAKFFALQGHQVFIITTEDRGNWYGINTGYEIQFISLYNSKSWLLPQFFYGFISKNFLKKNHFDYIIINNAPTINYGLGLIKDKPIAVSVVHNDHLEISKNAVINQKCLHAVVAVGPAVQKTTQKIIAEKQKLKLIVNGVEPPIALRENYYERNEVLKICIVGRVDHHQKGVLLIPKILEKLDQNQVDFRLTVIGEGSDLESLKKKCQKWIENEKIVFEGYQDHEFVKKAFLQNHVLLMPSNFEGFPLVLLESMMYGCVPIMSYLKNITDICFENQKEGFYGEKGISDSFAKILIDIFLGKFDLKSISINATHKAKKEFSNEVMANKYLDLYKSNIGNKINFRCFRPKFVHLLPLNVLRYYVEIKKKLNGHFK